MKLLTAKRKTLDLAWKKRHDIHVRAAKLYLAGYEVWGRGIELRNEGREAQPRGDHKLCKKGVKLCAKGDKMRSKGTKLIAKADTSWAKAIFKAYGNIEIKWKHTRGKAFYPGYECHLENGQVFVPQ